MVKVSLTITRRPFGPRQDFYVIQEEILTFPDLQTAKDDLKKRYVGHKRSKCYIDLPDGNYMQCGYIYHMKNPDGYEQHWTHFKEERTIDMEKEA